MECQARDVAVGARLVVFNLLQFPGAHRSPSRGASEAGR